MAVASGTLNHNFGNLGCGFVASTGTQYTYIDSVTSNGLQSNGKIEYVVKVSASVSVGNLVWSSATGTQSWNFSCGGQSQSATTNKQCQSTGNCAGGGCCCCICSGTTYNPGQKTFTIQLDPSVTTITASVSWNGNSNCTATYTIPASMRVTAPNGFGVSWPSTLGGSVYEYVTDWGGASSGTFYLSLLSSSGSVLATDYSSTSSTYRYMYNPGSTTANSRYRMRAQACNSVGCSSYEYSGYYYTNPPTPSVYINSIIYNPATKKCKCNWSWSKPTDGGYYNETITYDVYDNEGNYYVSGGSLGTATGGAAKSGTLDTDNILTAVNLCIKVYVTTTAGTSSATACAYAPVAGAAFLGFEWDELRRTCTVKATAPGARQTRVSGGYGPNNYNIGTKLTEGEFGDLVVKDLQHGTGQILYLEAMPESKDNHQYIDEVAKISIPIPNPIIGLKKYPCGSGKEDEYIVDIIEKKDGACTPRWNVGDRVVRVGACGQLPFTPPPGYTEENGFVAMLPPGTDAECKNGYLLKYDWSSYGVNVTCDGCYEYWTKSSSTLSTCTSGTFTGWFAGYLSENLPVPGRYRYELECISGSSNIPKAFISYSIMTSTDTTGSVSVDLPNCPSSAGEKTSVEFDITQDMLDDINRYINAGYDTTMHLNMQNDPATTCLKVQWNNWKLRPSLKYVGPLSS